MVWLTNRVAKAHTIPRGNIRRFCFCDGCCCSWDLSGCSKIRLDIMLLLLMFLTVFLEVSRRKFGMILRAQPRILLLLLLP